ncbi:hypothetical protein niasHS_002906 [Heterodera schachtii]|uniref:Uncharacterized protein n=1 Tax=Heterodera schachtii TaxID=97005 RepID=A0ABD2K985_HETSC
MLLSTKIFFLYGLSSPTPRRLDSNVVAQQLTHQLMAFAVLNSLTLNCPPPPFRLLITSSNRWECRRKSANRRHPMISSKNMIWSGAQAGPPDGGGGGDSNVKAESNFSIGGYPSRSPVPPAGPSRIQSTRRTAGMKRWAGGKRRRSAPPPPLRLALSAPNG